MSIENVLKKTCTRHEKMGDAIVVATFFNDILWGSLSKEKQLKYNLVSVIPERLEQKSSHDFPTYSPPFPSFHVDICEAFQLP